MKESKNFETYPMFKLVLSLAIPSMIAQFVNVLYSIVDRMFVGQIPEIGNQALAAIGVCGPIVTLLSSFGTLVGIGGSVWLSIRLGQKEHEKASVILYNSFILLVAVSLVLTFIFILLKNNLIVWFGASEQLYGYANTYLTIYTFGTFFALMAIGLNYFITCQGYAKIAMTTVIIGALTNIGLDFLLVKVMNYGVAGAAVATVIAQVCSGLFAICFLRSKFSTIRIEKKPLDFDVVKRIVRLGFSPFVIIASDSIIIIVMNAVLQHYGGPQRGDILISAITVAQSYFLLITGPLIGITSGTQAIISYNYGAMNANRIKEAFKYILMLAVGFCILMFIISLCFSNVFVSMFTDDIQTMPIADRAIRIFSSGIIFMAFQYVIVDGITALSNVKVSLGLSMNRKVIYLLATLLLPVFLGVEMTFYAQPIADVLSSLVSIFIFLRVLPPLFASFKKE